MIDRERNKRINEELQQNYFAITAEYLKEWNRAFPKESSPGRINEFGIIDEYRYDAENGILFICRETNGWSNEDYKEGHLFRSWMEDISRNGLEERGHIKQHPNMWYNIGRWITLIENPNTPLEEIASMKDSAIQAIGKIAFTNVNKARGYSNIGKEYNSLAHSFIAGEIIKKEIEIINPKTLWARLSGNNYYKY